MVLTAICSLIGLITDRNLTPCIRKTTMMYLYLAICKIRHNEFRYEFWNEVMPLSVFKSCVPYFS